MSLVIIGITIIITFDLELHYYQSSYNDDGIIWSHEQHELNRILSIKMTQIRNDLIDIRNDRTRG